MLAGMAGLHGVGDLRPDIHVPAEVLWLAGPVCDRLVCPDHAAVDAGRTGVALRLDGDRRDGPWSMGCAATLGLLAAGGTGEFLYFRF